MIFKPEIAADWRRRNHALSLRTTLAAIEVKASERDKGRLGPAEIIRDIRKLAAQKIEIVHLGADMQPVMMIIDTAPLRAERMTKTAIEAAKKLAAELQVAFFYVSQNDASAVF